MIKYFVFFDLSVPSYLLCAALGLCAALFFAFFRNSANRIKWSAYYLFIVFAGIGMIIGSKLLFFITVIPLIADDLSWKKALVAFLESGFVFYGGLLGALGCGAISVKLTKEDLRETFNLFIPPFVLFHTFGRIGCFLTGCCYGVECPVGFSYPYEPNIVRFPVQLAEAVGNIVILTVLLYREAKTQKRESLTMLYLIMYAPMRFLLEFLRDDSIRGFWGSLSTSQWISVFVIAVIAALEYKAHRSKACQ